MAKYDMSDFMSYRPPYPLIVLHTIIINNEIVRLSSQMLRLCVRTFLINKERIIVTTVIPKYGPLTYVDIRKSRSNLPRINRQSVDFQLA